MRLPITKTPRYTSAARSFARRAGALCRCTSADGTKLLGNVPHCTRKDLRNAVEAAAKAGPGWSKRTAYNRGQILYRLAEMLESRADEMAAALPLISDARAEGRRRGSSRERWTVSSTTPAGRTNTSRCSATRIPVAGPYFNFTLTEPMGVVGVIARRRASLARVAESDCAGHRQRQHGVAFASETHPARDRAGRDAGDERLCPAG